MTTGTIYTDIGQRTPEWHAMRCGKATASRMADITARTKTGYGASRANYLAQLVAERMTGTVEPGFTSAAMQWGTDKEPDARAAYEFYASATVDLVAFVDHPMIAMSGASPDGLVGEHGLIEIKCPNTAGHIDTLLGSSLPTKYVQQMQWQMRCTDRRWCDFVSFDPRMPEDLRLFVRRVIRDDVMIADLEDAVRVFLAEVAAKVTALENLRARSAA